MRLGRRAKPVDARTEVLARIRAALESGHDEGAGYDREAPGPQGQPGAGAEVTAPPAAGRAPHGVARRRVHAAAPSRTYRSHGEHQPGAPELLEMLVDRLVDYRAVVHEVDESEVPGTISRVLAGVSSAAVPAWLDAGWIAAATAAGVRLVSDVPTVSLRAEALDSVEVVLTAARVAIAETGTIVLDAAQDQGRRIITLLPDRHICVVRAEQVVQTVPEAIRILERAPTRPQTWISGPSATSDIELTRVEGVHGPRTLEVVLVRSR
jgi:L-lactate dehydrogenase complex protein LldG